MKYTLITGVAGVVGFEIARQQIISGNNVIGIDLLNEETRTILEKKHDIQELNTLAKINNVTFIFSELNIKSSQIENIFKRHKIKTVIHCASLVRDRVSVFSAAEFLDNNVVGTAHLLEVIKQHPWVEHIVFTSTRSAIGEANSPDDQLDETSPFSPINPYGASKASVEHLLHSFSANYQIPITIFRLNPQICDRRDMMPRILIDAALTGQSIVKFGDGSATRDWLDVRDTARAINLCLLNPEGIRVFCIGNERITTLNELIYLVETMTSRTIQLIHQENPIGDAIHSGIFSTQKAQSALNWKPEFSLEQSLLRLIELRASQILEKKRLSHKSVNNRGERLYMENAY